MSGLFPLVGNQQPAVDPGEVVWLSASAWTGKTQVLSARVLRLLLQGDVRPQAFDANPWWPYLDDLELAFFVSAAIGGIFAGWCSSRARTAPA